MTTGFLVTNFSSKLLRLRDEINKNVLKKLYIYISVSSNQTNFKNSDWISKRILDIYTSSCQLFPNLDVRIILNDLKLPGGKCTKISDYDVDVIMIPKNFDETMIYNIKSQRKNASIVYVDDITDDEFKPTANTTKMYSNVVLGGTFDRFHTGHKILISEALLRCSGKLTVGVTDGDMIKNKKLWELIEPCSSRMKSVETFIKEVDATVIYEVVPITDMYGPTKTDPYFKLLVVSSETSKGGHKINELRKQCGLNELDIHVVDLALDSQRSGEEERKISSSNIRMRVLGSYIKNPEPKKDKPCKPYIVGLTGGAASGKSSICDYLKKLGAGVIDCDKIGHQLYKSGSEIYNELINLFGQGIVSENGEINRKELGQIVFNDFEKLQMLNNLMWPAILNSALSECERLYTKEKKEIIILEAAVLLRAGWVEEVHEVWATIIPPSEAINRLVKRNGLTEKEAALRLEAQPSNSELVEVANVVFCSLWTHDFTRRQVDKAWNKLKSFV